MHDDTYPFLTAEHAEAMRHAARAELEALGHHAVVEGGEALLEAGGAIGFDNLARSIAEIPAHSPEFTAIVGHYVAAVVESLRAEPEPITEEVLAERGYLRLVDATMIPPSVMDQYTYAERVGDHALAIVAVDEPHIVRTVPGTDLAAVGVDRARQLGYVNLLRDTDFEREPVEAKGGTIHSLAGPSMFVGSRLLALAEEIAKLGAEAPYGAIAIAPDRHHLHFHIIEDLGVVKIVNLLQNVALGAYDEEQGAISPCVYWWHGGTITQLTAFDADGRASINVPEELTEILNTLA
jgi:hypothetical protein